MSLFSELGNVLKNVVTKRKKVFSTNGLRVFVLAEILSTTDLRVVIVTAPFLSDWLEEKKQKQNKNLKNIQY